MSWYDGQQYLKTLMAMAVIHSSKRRNPPCERLQAKRWNRACQFEINGFEGFNKLSLTGTVLLTITPDQGPNGPSSGGRISIKLASN